MQKSRTLSCSGLVGEGGFDLHFRLRRKLWCRCRPAGSEQHAAGILHSDGFESTIPNTKTNKKHHPNGWCFFIGGGRWIRTTEAISSRFTVCPLWPLGNSPIFSSSERNAGAGRRTRTPDLLITNQLLYRLSYTGVSNRT